MGTKINFLEYRSQTALRREITNITNSYNNSWDYLSELAQNSFDAIRRYNRQFPDNGRRHEISITFDVPRRAITFKDTGVGINSSIVKDILAPNGTDKEDETESIGEKGVGLTYAIFSCNEFQIRTQTTDTYFEGKVSRASAWRNRIVEEIPELEVIREENTEKTPETYTDITLGDIDKFDCDDLFDQSIEVVEYILRTKTVIGYLKAVFGEKAEAVDVSLRYIDYRGEERKLHVENKYMLPDSFLSKKDTINFDEFIPRAAAYDDKRKARELQGKAIYKIGSVVVSNRKINYYCFYAPKRDLYDEISRKNKLQMVDQSGEPVNLLTSGIFVATKGMPTGIVLDPPVSGVSGYWPNFYILLEDDGIVFDLGRKTVPSRTKGTLRSVAKNLFSEILPYIQYISLRNPNTKANTNATIAQYEKQNAYQGMLDKLPKLDVSGINYLKNPNQQEAAVVAIFHELVGAGLLKGYYSLSTGYKQTYDLWCRYRIPREEVGDNYEGYARNGEIDIPCVIEFKYKAEAILTDLEEDIKFFNDMDLIVCWDIDDNVFARNSVEVERLARDDVLFYGSNYKLVWPGAYNLGQASEKPVLSLRQFVEKLARDR